MTFVILTFVLLAYCMFKGFRTKKMRYVLAIISLSIPWLATSLMLEFFQEGALVLLLQVALASYFSLVALILVIAMCVDFVKICLKKIRKDAILPREEAR